MPKPYRVRPNPRPDEIEALKAALLARIHANNRVTSWFAQHCRCEWLGGDAEADNNSVGAPWLYRLAQADISDTDKMWLLDAAVLSDTFSFDDACRLIGIDPTTTGEEP